MFRYLRAGSAGLLLALAGLASASQPAELKLLAEHPVEGLQGGNLSGLAWCGDALLAVSDRDDDRLYRLDVTGEDLSNAKGARGKAAVRATINKTGRLAVAGPIATRPPDDPTVACLRSTPPARARSRGARAARRASPGGCCGGCAISPSSMATPS